jgi:mannose-6-phosphate isomerase-like protein (cupin superfamily)
MSDIKPVGCPCGTTRRAFIDDPEKLASLHVVDIKEDSETHYHKRLTEIYYILDGEGHMELEGELYPVEPDNAVLIKPGCRHRAVGRLKVIVVCLPACDPEDEWFE